MHADVSSTAGISQVLPTCPFQKRITRKTAIFFVSRPHPSAMPAAFSLSLRAIIVPRKITSECSLFTCTLGAEHSHANTMPNDKLRTTLNRKNTPRFYLVREYRTAYIFAFVIIVTFVTVPIPQRRERINR
jgi:hypothetical protein